MPLLTPEYFNIKSKHRAFAKRLVRDDQIAGQNKIDNPDEWLSTWLMNINKIIDYTRMVDSLNLPYFRLETAEVNVCIMHFFQLWDKSQVLSNEDFIRNNQYLLGLKDINFDNNAILPFLINQTEKGCYSKNDLAYLLSLSKYPFPYEIVKQFDELVFIKDPNLLEKTGEIYTINDSREFLGVDTYQEYYLKARFIDSLQNAGDLFKPIPQDSIIDHYNRIESGCYYDFVRNYRMNMFFTKHDDALFLFDEEKNKYGIK